MVQRALSDDFSRTLLERRNKAFMVLYDTLLDIQGAGEESTIEILCRKLCEISKAKLTALASCDVKSSRITLEAVVVESGDALNPAVEIPSHTVTVPADNFTQFTQTHIQPCSEKKTFIQKVFGQHIDKWIAGIDMGDPYDISIVRGKELVALGMVILPPYQKLDLRDLIDTYLNMAGIVMQRFHIAGALRESRKKYRTVVEHGNDGIVIIQDSRIKYTNPRFTDITGYSLDEISRTDLCKNLQPNTPAAGNSGEKASSYEAALRHKNGRRIETECNASIIPYESSPATLVFVRDVTERKMMESQIAQMQKLEAIGTLGAGIAHEINTPLQYISSNTRFLQDSFGDITKAIGAYTSLRDAVNNGSVNKDLVAAVDKAIKDADIEFLFEEIPGSIKQSLDGLEKVAQIVQAMKEFSQVETKEKVATDINKCIENTITVARSEWSDSADMVTELDSSLPHVPVLPGEFNQVILNIIINAAHAISKKPGHGADAKGTITIKTMRDAENAVIRISDTGTGIPENIRAKVFEPFFTTKAVGTGTGQGMAIAHATIKDKHGGKISFESEVGIGTTFIIRLPLNG